jgi:AsmA protein
MKMVLKVMIIVLLSILIIPYLIPSKLYKNIIENKVAMVLGHNKLLINGDVSLTLLPIAVTLNQVTLPATEGFTNPLLKVDKIKVALDMMYLLQGKIHLSKVELQNPVVYVEQSNIGKSNWGVFLNKNKKKDIIVNHLDVGNVITPHSPTSNEIDYNHKKSTSNYIHQASYISGSDKVAYNESADVKAVDKQYMTNGEVSNTIKPNEYIMVDVVDINNGKIVLINKNKKKTEIDKLDLKTKFNNKDSLVDFVLNAIVLKQKLLLQGKVKEIAKLIPITLNLDFMEQNLHLDGHVDINDVALYGVFKCIGKFNDIGLNTKDMPYKIGGRLAINPSVVNINHLYMDLATIHNISGEINYQIKNNLVNLELVAEKTKFTGELKPKDNNSDILDSSLNFKIENLYKLLSKMKVTDQNLLKLASDTISFNSDIMYQNNDFQAKNLLIKLGNSSFSGNVGIKNWDKKELTVNYLLQTDNVNDLLKKMLHIEGNLPLKIMGEVKQNNNLYQFSNKTNLLGSDVDIAGNLAFNKNKHELNLNVKSSVLNLDKLLFSNKNTAFNNVNNNLFSNNIDMIAHNDNKDEVKSNDYIVKVAETNTKWSKEKFNFSIFEQFNGKINFIIDKLIVRNMTFQNVTTNLLIKDSELILAPTKLNSVDGGVVNLESKILTKDDGSLSLIANAQDIHLHNIVPKHEKISIISGKVNANIQIQSKLSSTYTFVNNLQGKITISAKDGVINGINLHKIIDSLNNPSRPDILFKDIYSAWKSGQTKFDKLDAGFTINSGVVNIDNCMLYANKVTTSTAGNINLPQYNLNTTTKIQIMDYPHLDVQVFGNLDATEHKVLADSFISHVMKNVLNSVIKDAKSGNLDPKNLLKQVIGGFKGNNTKEPANDNKQPDDKKPEQEIHNKLNKLLKHGKKFLKQ